MVLLFGCGRSTCGVFYYGYFCGLIGIFKPVPSTQNQIGIYKKKWVYERACRFPKDFDARIPTSLKLNWKKYEKNVKTLKI